MKTTISASTEWLVEDEMPEWLKKCLTCTHCYKRIEDDETIHCRCRKGCNYKPHKNKLLKSLQ